MKPNRVLAREDLVEACEHGIGAEVQLAAGVLREDGERIAALEGILSEVRHCTTCAEASGECCCEWGPGDCEYPTLVHWLPASVEDMLREYKLARESQGGVE